MQFNRLVLLLLCMAVLSSSHAAHAQGRWTMRNLLPTGKKVNLSAGKRTRKVSPLKKLNQGTRRFFTQVKSAFTPKKKKVSAKRPPAGAIGTRGFYNPTRQKKKPSLLSSLFWREQPKPPPKTVLDFLAQDRPDF